MTVGRCLGTRVVTVTTVSNSPPHDTSNNNKSKRAALLIEFENDGRVPVLKICLSTGISSHGCIVSPSDVSSVWQQDGVGGDNDDDAARMLRLGRLLLREEDDPAKQDGSDQNLVVAFHQYENEYGNNNRQNNHGFRSKTTNDKSSYHQSNRLVFIIQERVMNHMRRTVHRQTLGKTTNDDGLLSYCVTVGTALNKTLREVDTLKAGLAHWKNTAQDLGRIQQENKDALLANFTKLRNQLVEKHHTELEKRKACHEKEKEAWEEASRAAAAASYKKKLPKQKDPDEDSLRDDFNKELIVGEDALALAEGRKLKSGSTKSNTDDNDNEIRKAVLKADEAIDMVEILRQGQAYERNRKEETIRKKKRKLEKTESENDVTG